MKLRIFIIFTIFSLILIPILANETFAQNGTLLPNEACGGDTIQDQSTGQCIPRCGDGTGYNGTHCVEITPWGGLSELDWIVIGIIVGIIVAGVGIIFTVDQRKKEQRREANELIQKYGNQLSEIVNQENDLKTKLDCALYTERFLDNLEQIAKLYHSDLLGDKVTNYFDNEFRYGRNLWRWYRENVEKYPDYQLNLIEEDLSEVSKRFRSYSEKKPPGFIHKYFVNTHRDEFRKKFDNAYAIKEETKEIVFGKDDRWYHFMERCCWKGISPFTSLNMSDILKKRTSYLTERIDYLEKEINSFDSQKSESDEDLEEYKKEKLSHENVRKNLKALQFGLDKKRIEEKKKNEQFNDDDLKFEEKEIRAILDTAKVKPADQLGYVRRYSEGAENKILPDIMELEYEDIPDENGLSNFEILEIVQKYSERIAELKSKETKLISKQDCAIYAEQYLDTVDEIASLYRQKLFPQSALTYFQNSFGYGLNLMIWYFTNVRKSQNYDFDPQKTLTQKELDQEEDRWIDLRWICRGGDSRAEKNQIKKFDDIIESDLYTKKNANGQFILPDPMYRYDELPDEEGIPPDEVLEIMRGYGDALIKLTEKERGLETKLDCALYAEQYLDVLDQIAYLLNHNALATDSSTFFENNFAFGLTLKIWYDMKVAGAKGQEGRWDEFLFYCNHFTDDDYIPQVLKAFRLVDVLPVSMLFVDDLPADPISKSKDFSYIQEDGKIKNIPKIFYVWEKEYLKWVEHQERLKKYWEGYFKWFGIPQKLIDSQKEYENWRENQDKIKKSCEDYEKSLENQDSLMKEWNQLNLDWLAKYENLKNSWDEYEKYIVHPDDSKESWDGYEQWVEHEEQLKTFLEESYNEWQDLQKEFIMPWYEYRKWLNHNLNLINSLRHRETQKRFEYGAQLEDSFKKFKSWLVNKKKKFESDEAREDVQKFLNEFKYKHNIDP